MDERSRRIARRFEVPMLIAALLVIPLVVLDEGDFGQPSTTVAHVLNWGTWLAFPGGDDLGVLPGGRQPDGVGKHGVVEHADGGEAAPLEVAQPLWPTDRRGSPGSPMRPPFALRAARPAARTSELPPSRPPVPAQSRKGPSSGRRRGGWTRSWRSPCRRSRRRCSKSSDVRVSDVSQPGHRSSRENQAPI
jgi:hypothetical protein